MKIIQQGILPKQKQYKCANCGCIFELDVGEKANRCPCCDYDIILEKDIEPEKIKKETIDSVYPDKYYEYGSNKNGKCLSLEETQKMIRDCIKSYFNNGGGYATISSGNALVLVTQNDVDNINDYRVVVTKHYYKLDSFEV